MSYLVISSTYYQNTGIQHVLYSDILIQETRYWTLVHKHGLDDVHLTSIDI